MYYSQGYSWGRGKDGVVNAKDDCAPSWSGMTMGVVCTPGYSIAEKCRKLLNFILHVCMLCFCQIPLYDMAFRSRNIVNIEFVKVSV